MLTRGILQPKLP